MPEQVSITVKFDPSRASLNRRLHWTARRAINAVAKRAAWYGWHEAGCPVIEGPARMSLLVRRARALDTDNLVSGAKAALDFLCGRRKTGEGICWDDSPAWLEWEGIKQEVGKQWRGREEMVFTFVAREEANDRQAISRKEPS